MNCSEFRHALDHYTLLDESELAKMEHHAQLCEQCEHELKFYRAMIQTTASIPFPEPPADLIDRVNAQIDREPKLTRTFNRLVWDVKNNARRYAALAACLIVGLTVGLNSDGIKSGLSGADDDGVISRNTVSGSETETPQKEISDNPEAAADEPTDHKESGQTTEQPSLNTEPAKNNAEPEKQPKPAVSLNKPPAATQQILATIKPAVKKETSSSASAAPAKSLPAAQEVPKETVSSETAQPITPAAAAPEPDTANESQQSVDTDSLNQSARYTIARDNYYIPKKRSSQVAETPDPGAYEINKDGYQIAQGDFGSDARETGTATAASISDMIIVSSADAEAATRLIAQMGISSANGLYTTTNIVFSDLLKLFDQEGIGYDYSLQFCTGERVVFKLVTR